MRRQQRSWLIALWVAGGLALLVIMAIVILPPVLSADYHRAAIEALASRLTGRQVIIKGPIRLSMVPDPQLSAATIQIGMPHGEQISAASLRLDLAPRALLLGRLRATRLTLHAPRIVIPWPLPDGAASILPPPWLASLHAKVEDGTIILGRLVFKRADLSIFTGGRNALLAASGTGTMFGTPVSVKLSLAGVNSQGLTPVTASIATPIAALARQKARLSFSGTVNAESRLTGRLTGSAVPAMAQALPLGHVLPDEPVAFSASASASRGMIRLTAIRLRAGTAALDGSAAIGLTTGLTSLRLRGHDIDITPAVRLLRGQESGPWNSTMDLRASLTNARLAGFAFTKLVADFGITPEGTAIRAFSASLPGQGRLGLTGAISRHGLTGSFVLADQTPSALVKAAAKAVPGLSGLPALTGALHLAGSVNIPDYFDGSQQTTLRLDRLHGRLGSNNQDSAALATGAIVAKVLRVDKTRRLDIAASLGFDQLDATKLLDFIKAGPSRIKGLRLDLALTARRARLGGVEAKRFLLDAKLGERLTIRTLDFHALTQQGKPAALVALHGTSAGRVISGANLIIAGPDAAQALALLPGSLALLDTRQSRLMMQAPFAASLSAAGPLARLAAQATIDLGDIRVRAAPRINLVNHTALGPVSLRMPDAIALVKPWDRQAGLAWPGAGSAGLRADFTYAPRHLGLSNFVLSFGALTASGRLALDYSASPYRLSGVVNADTLALPPLAELLQLANAPGRLNLDLPEIRAAHIRLGETDIADDASAGFAAMPRAVTLQLRHATLAGGMLTGHVVLNQAVPNQAGLNAAAGITPPLLKVDLQLADANAAALRPAFAAAGFPAMVASGRLTARLNGQASGYTAKTWAATLGGTLTASGENLTVQGLGLAGAAALIDTAATAPDAAKLRQALLSGTTNFTAMTLDGGFASGAFTGNAELTGDAGSATLAGTIDLPDRSLAVTAALQPKPVKGPVPEVTLTFSGPWAKPRRIVDTAPGTISGSTPGQAPSPVP